MLASLATIMKEKTALVTSMVYFALTLWKIHTVGQWYLFYGIAFIIFSPDSDQFFYLILCR